MAEHNLPPALLPQTVTITFTSGIFLGLYLTSLAYADRWLIFTDDGWKLRKNMNRYTVTATSIFAVLVAVDQAVNVDTSMVESSYAEGGYELEKYIESPWRMFLKCIIFAVSTLLADAVLMYRLWHTYGRQMSVMWLPLILWLGDIACFAIDIILRARHLHEPYLGPYNISTVSIGGIGPGVVRVPFLASTIVLNAYCTGLLIWRIWSTLEYRNGENSGVANQLQILIRILMESGALYLSISVADLVVYFGSDRFTIRMLGTLRVIVVGIAHNLIIIRVGRNRSEESDNRRRSDRELSTLVFSRCQNEGISTSSATSPMSEGKIVLRKGELRPASHAV